mmetsp:Transcript_29449/g.43681  ORF Transcript_29449/g.43681 Transcript_29449/m.43681 type:complete len:97 (+) Transcript_29449:356-646(+)
MPGTVPIMPGPGIPDIDPGPDGIGGRLPEGPPWAARNCWNPTKDGAPGIPPGKLGMVIWRGGELSPEGGELVGGGAGAWGAIPFSSSTSGGIPSIP